MNLDEWKERHRARRNLAHFDTKVSLAQVWDYVSDPEKIATHGFYPFINYTLSVRKYDESSDNKTKVKDREICYSAHIDRYIYQYYGFLLNQHYNKRAEDDGIEEASIAYRDKLHRNNIRFAKRAIDFIKSKPECYIIIGDFAKFFDSLDHEYLKRKLCDLLDEKRLSADYYAVYKNITKYSTWSREHLLSHNMLGIKKKDIIAFNKLDRAISVEQFKKLKKLLVKPHKENCGIPQGSAISAVFSNIYMLDFDKSINNYVLENDGLYMRYSDDFIIVLPKSTSENFKTQYQQIRLLIESIPRVELELEKTQLFEFSGGTIKSCNEDVLENVPNGPSFMNYLGFTFDGKSVSIRAKTTSRYYNKLYRKIRTVTKNKGVTKKGERLSCKNLYSTYSIKGAFLGNNHEDGNFITYAKRAESIFYDEPAVALVSKRHMQKIRKKLKKVARKQ
ncbi:reverse transcriptase/maturase family protein [Paenibacillus sp. FSL H8-0537]|uniref:reverse transcriptase/maturase family protein n=1 Tax=Paenibacillus sp. FSL H8-0537 TaxID=2921399 RepID=UPI003101AE55